MAITRAQQAKQMLQDGGMLVKPGFGGTRQGYRGPGGYQGSRGRSVERPGGNTNRERGITQRGEGPKGTTGRIDRPQADPRPAFEMIGGERVNIGDTLGRQRALERSNIFEPPKRFQGIRSLASKFNPLSLILGLINPALGIASRFITQQAPETFRTFKDSPTLADFIKNMREEDDSPVFVDSGRGSGLRPTIDTKPTIPVVIDDDMSLIPRINESDMSLTPEQKQLIEEDQLGDIENLMAGLTKQQQKMLSGPQKNLRNIMGLSDEEILQNIAPFNNPEDPATLEEVRNFYKVADGGMIGGGIMDAAGRQQYFLGKLVKKATRAVKKIVKSPIGKLGIGAALAFTPFAKETILPKLFKAGKLTGMGKLALAGGLSAAPLLFQEEEDEGQQLASMGSVGGQIDPRAYTDPYGVLYSAFKAEGGSMKDEPVAKRTMPLLDMDGQEMDLRAEGGFVPIGRMEKADDVPARLSKNEFVFTADAVRNAGDGDVDKGAEVMYNMMKNLEAGGDVSEESQGKEGARRMFQTSQRLEEVL